MKIRAAIVLVLCLFSQLLFAQQQTLPIVKGGIWHLRKNGSEIRLPETYSYVHTFDTKGYAYFQRGGNYGIINEQGQEIVPPNFRDVTPLGNGYFKCQKDTVQQIVYSESGKIEQLSCKQASKLDENWVFYVKSNQHFLLNTAKPLTIPLDSAYNYTSIFNHIIFDLDSNGYLLYDSNGEKIYDGKASLSFDFDYARIFSQNFNYIFDRYGGTWHYPQNAKFIDVSKEYIHYQDGNTAYLLDRDSKKQLFSFPGEQINVLQGYYLVQVNGKNGLMNATKKWLIEPKYDFFEFGNEYIEVNFNTLVGLFDKKFRLIVPCKYKNINYDSLFFYTTAVNGYEGLISRKTNKEILPAVYDRIELKGNLLKAWANGNLMLLELTPTHGLKNKLVLENTISLRQKERIWSNANFDPRLFALGWYYDSLKGNESKLLPNSKYKWGLKNEKDSILVKPTYTSATYIPGAGFSMLSEWLNPKEIADLNTNNYQNIPRFKYRLVDYTTGKMLPTAPIEHLDTTDLQFRSFTRFRDTTEYGVVFQDNSVKKMKYLDLRKDEFIRYCTGGVRKIVFKKSSTTIEFQSMNLRKNYYLNFPSNMPSKAAGFEISGGKWNFLTPKGDSLFREGFDFAEAFHKKTAIVQLHKMWGVVSPDTLVIPFQYHSIKRITAYKDSVFMVGVSSGKELFLDTNLNVVSSQSFVFEEKRGSLIHIKENKKNVVLNEGGERIYETEKSIKWHDFNRMVVKENKAFSIIDEKGQSIGEVKVKPERFFSPNSFLAKEISKYGVLSLNEDTLIPFDFKEIEAYPDFIIAQNSAKSCIYDTEYELLDCLEGAKLLVDSVSGLWAASYPAKVVVYDAKGKTIAKLKSNDVVFHQFYNKRLFSNTNKTQALNLDGTWVELKGKKSDFAAFPDGFFGVEFDNKFWRIYDKNWKSVSSQLPEMKRPQYIGDAILSARSEGKLVLFDAANGAAYNEYEPVEKNWESDLLLVKTSAKYYPFQFINRSFENPFSRDFTTANAFAYGFASVCDERGCTLINSRGFQKSYPSFNPMTIIGPNLIRTTEKIKYGIIDSQGKTILKPEYEKISFLNDGIIQAVRDGNISYFDMGGKVIY